MTPICANAPALQCTEGTEPGEDARAAAGRESLVRSTASTAKASNVFLALSSSNEELSSQPQRTTSVIMPFTASDIFKIILAVILPPLGVFLERGCGADLLINILLTILGYIPGIIHALYIILKY
ncbi:hypothetical protein P8C59_003029 [Phyllachora maydis]|uniref:Plasma membrane proteolipid 3 n=1 Tax=Phyllachora maydis TaxID=1825666 RepID=A0AAD9I0S3_9PEZI|nr:hypothetical protein P8C59_003029 [Phyllachora maydis]